MYDTGEGYPAVVFENDGGLVPGFVVELVASREDEAVAVLDRIEGEGTLYRRVKVTTSEGAAQSYEWIGPVDSLTPLPAGWTA